MKYDKLVRDRIPEIIEQNGAIATVRTLDDAEYRLELDKKLQEEVGEYLADKNLEELADILEVIYAIAENEGSDRHKLELIRAEKAAKRGAFKQKIFLIATNNQ
jgi:predicted house-cleaning noncanonical NTP pyrophosphatase (MazG superfamily)